MRYTWEDVGEAVGAEKPLTKEEKIKMAEEYNAGLDRMEQDEQDEGWMVTRGIRDDKLRDCDWVILKAQEEGKTVSDEWKTYRQKLRDIPQDYKKFEDVKWPTQPS